MFFHSLSLSLSLFCYQLAEKRKTLLDSMAIQSQEASSGLQNKMGSLEERHRVRDGAIQGVVGGAAQDEDGCGFRYERETNRNFYCFLFCAKLSIWNSYNLEQLIFIYLFITIFWLFSAGGGF